MSPNKRRWIPRSVKLVPAALISVIVLAITSLLGLLNFDIDTPTISSGPAPAVSEPVTEPPAEAPAQFANITADSVETSEPGEATEAAFRPAVVDIVIDGDSYLLQVPDGQGGLTRRSRSLQEIVSLAAEVPGDASGVKARISRTFTAIAQAEQRLIEALQLAGLSDDEIDQRRTLIE